MKQYLLSKLEDLEEKLKTDLNNVDNAICELSMDVPVTYHVQISSYWRGEGEIFVRLGRPDLREALKFAIRDYRKLNGNPSVRAWVFVTAEIGGIHISIDDEQFNDIYEELLNE